MSKPPKRLARKEIDIITKIQLINDYNTKPQPTQKDLNPFTTEARFYVLNAIAFST